ncbi:hypothetical protein QQF64_004315 [Cirrhinus molitorella]|uniref:Uncharacterized protein n=1 Tax=Cirrhinus molitorella TaxID=172907 RepID=A0ABR3MFU2_9TELE
MLPALDRLVPLRKTSFNAAYSVSIRSCIWDYRRPKFDHRSKAAHPSPVPGIHLLLHPSACLFSQRMATAQAGSGLGERFVTDRALRDVHENFEEKKQKKREGFGMRQHAYLLPCREGPEGTMGVSHECDEPSPDNRLREHCVHLSHTGLEWRQPPTPSHSSRLFFSPLHHVCVGRH